MRFQLTPQLLHLIAASAVALNRADTITPSDFGEGYMCAEIDRLATAAANCQPGIGARTREDAAVAGRLHGAALAFVSKLQTMGADDFGALAHEPACDNLRAALDRYGIETGKEAIQL